MARDLRHNKEPCEYCSGYWGTKVRLFSSEEEFKQSEYFGGGDTVINDPGSSIAVWPGKNNVGRTHADWWLCAPVHPYCGCSIVEGEIKDSSDWFKDIKL